MDLWLIVATAATGYIAKYVQNVSKGKDVIFESSSEGLSNVKPESRRCVISRLVRVKKPKEESFGARKLIADGEGPDIQERNNAYGMEEPSTGGEGSGNNEDVHSNSSVSLMPEFMENGGQDWPIHNLPMGDRRTNPFHDALRNRAFLRRKQRYKRLIKPFNSLESRLVTQFHREQMTMEEYMLSPLTSPWTPITRPLVVTDGARVISGNRAEALSGHIQDGNTIAHARGIPPLRKLPMIIRNGTNVSRRRRVTHGPSGAAVILCVGISIGIISSFIARRNEEDKLKKVLQQTENLVQDLQDELEMNVSLTVKDLENGNAKTNNLDATNDGGGQCERKSENSDSMSKIEAELEAELERLELNINTSNIETQLSDMIDLDPDDDVDFARGELRADRVKKQPLDGTESNQDPSGGNSTPESGNHAVSPRELCLRLHEVINSRLEERVKELEMALQETQKEVEQLHMEAERRMNSWSSLWGSHEVMTHEREREIQVATEHTQKDSVETGPLVMNLAGEALDAYSEAYDDLMKINNDSEEEEEDLPSNMHNQRRREQEQGSVMDKNTTWTRESYVDSSRTVEKVSFSVQDLLDVVALSEDEYEENSDVESEMEKQLIKQIVEKTKQGSPVVLNAQKMLFLMEEREHNR